MTVLRQGPTGLPDSAGGGITRPVSPQSCTPLPADPPWRDPSGSGEGRAHPAGHGHRRL